MCQILLLTVNTGKLEMKKKDKFFLGFYLCIVVVGIIFTHIMIGIEITSLGGAVLMTVFYLLIGVFARIWFNQQWEEWEKQDSL